MSASYPIYNPREPLSESMYRGPREDFLGHKLHVRFGMAACPATMDSAYVSAAFAHGFDVVTYKTQRSVRYPANSFPNVMELQIDGDLSVHDTEKPLIGSLPDVIDPANFTLANSCGINSEGPEFWTEDLSKALKSAHKGQLLIASVVGTLRKGMAADEYYDDFARTAELAVGAGAEVIEVNLSCPNVVGEGVICYDSETVMTICRRVKNRIGNVPMLIKLGYFNSEQEQLLHNVVKLNSEYIAGVSAINTIAAPIVDKSGQPAFPGPGRSKAGVSGKAIKWAGIHMVGRLKALRELLGLEYVIVGMGGVMAPDDYIEYRQAGADLVQSATGAMWNPDLASAVRRANAGVKLQPGRLNW